MKIVLSFLAVLAFASPAYAEKLTLTWAEKVEQALGKKAAREWCKTFPRECRQPVRPAPAELVRHAKKHGGLY